MGAMAPVLSSMDIRDFANQMTFVKNTFRMCTESSVTAVKVTIISIFSLKLGSTPSEEFDEYQNVFQLFL
jgi:hypothetical protein